MAIRPYKKIPNKWQIDISMGYDENKKQKRYSEIFEGTREQAYLYHQMLTIKIQKARKKTTQAIIRSIESISVEYLQWVCTHQTPATYRWKKRLLFSSILPFFGKFYPDTITRQDIDSFQHDRLNEVKSPNAKGGLRIVNAELIVLSGLIKWAKERKLCADLLPEYDKLKYKRPIPDILTEEEIISFLDHAEPFWKIIFLLLYQAGMRKEEVLPLMRDQIDIKARQIKVHGKGDKQRIVPMSHLLYGILSEYVKPFKKGAYLFINPKTEKPYTDIRKAITRIKKRAGLTDKRITPHLLRHSFGGHLISNGIDVRTIQELLGHADVHTTELYTQVSMKHKREAIDIINQLLTSKQ